MNFVVGRLTPASVPGIIAVPNMEYRPTLPSIIRGLTVVLAQLEDIVQGLEIQLRDMHELRTGDAPTDFALNGGRGQLLKEMALASELMVQIKASIGTGEEVLGL